MIVMERMTIALRYLYTFFYNSIIVVFNLCTVYSMAFYTVRKVYEMIDMISFLYFGYNYYLYI